MRILVTGTSAQHYSSAVAQRTTTYAGLLAYALELAGHEVRQAEPNVLWTDRDLAAYDKVLVGLTSPISVSANGAYGALNLVSVLRDTEKLCFFVDAPEPGKIFSGLRAVEKDKTQLVKSFYSRRAGYGAVAADGKLYERLCDAAEWLLNEQWPKTLWPTLPWFFDADNIVGVSDAAKSSMVGLCLDSLVATQPSIEALRTRRNRLWGVDLESSRWVKLILKTLSFEHEPIKNKKQMSNSDIDARLSTLHGVIFTIHDDKRPWWSPLIARALSSGTPVVTDWRYSQQVGDAWSALAGAVEALDQVSAYELAVTQARQYMYKIETKEEILTKLRQVVDGR